MEYFIDVDDFLKGGLGAPGLTVEVFATETEPAGSFYRRAAKLADQVAEHHSMDAKAVHFVGHSTGGLDIRLLLSPGNGVEKEHERRAAAGDEGARKVLDALQKTRSATSVATPHYGSPIASLALRLDVDLVLRAASQVLELAPMNLLLAKGLQVAGMITGLMNGLARDESFMKWVTERVFSEPPEKLIKYLEHIGADAGALRNLTQEGTNLANALLLDRPDVRYGSIITGTQKPSGAIKTPNPFLFFTTLLFRGAWQIVAAENSDYPYADRNDELSSRHQEDVSAGLDVGELHFDNDVNDGVVPTASQAYGTILGAFASDHLDCVGHYPHTQGDGTEVTGWVRSGADFNSDRFGLMWARISDFIAAGKRPGQHDISW